MVIGVTGASGALGRQVVSLLSAAGHQVVALTRRPQGYDAPPATEVRHADFDAPPDLPTAFAGVTRLLLISTDSPDPARRTAQHTAAIAAAAAAGVREIAYTSLTAADGPPEMLNAAHRATEEALRTAGPAWAVLRNNLYAEGIGQMIAGALATGRHVTNAGPGAVAFVRRADCAATAAALLTGAFPTGQTLDVTGPAGLVAEDLAALATTRTGRPTEVVHLPDDAYRDHLLAAGLPAPVASALVVLGQAIRSGTYARVSGTVAALTGRAPAPAGTDLLAA